jgi:hypothetical protein
VRRPLSVGLVLNSDLRNFSVLIVDATFLVCNNALMGVTHTTQGAVNMIQNTAFSMPAAYGQSGVRLTVEGGDKIRVWGEPAGMKAEVELSLKTHQALALAADLLRDAGQSELAASLSDVIRDAYQQDLAEA